MSEEQPERRTERAPVRKIAGYQLLEHEDGTRTESPLFEATCEDCGAVFLVVVPALALLNPEPHLPAQCPECRPCKRCRTD